MMPRPRRKKASATDKGLQLARTLFPWMLGSIRLVGLSVPHLKTRRVYALSSGLITPQSAGRRRPKRHRNIEATTRREFIHDQVASVPPTDVETDTAHSDVNLSEYPCMYAPNVPPVSRKGVHLAAKYRYCRRLLQSPFHRCF